MRKAETCPKGSTGFPLLGIHPPGPEPCRGEQESCGHCPSPTRLPGRKRRLAKRPDPQLGLTSMLPTVRAQPTTFSPCWTKARATAAPMPPEAPVTNASRSRHRSMPALAGARAARRLAELLPGSHGLGRSLLTAAPPASESRRHPPSFWRGSGWGSTLRSLATGQIQPSTAEHRPAPSGPAPRPASPPHLRRGGHCCRRNGCGRVLGARGLSSRGAFPFAAGKRRFRGGLRQARRHTYSGFFSLPCS